MTTCECCGAPTQHQDDIFCLSCRICVNDLNLYWEILDAMREVAREEIYRVLYHPGFRSWIQRQTVCVLDEGSRAVVRRLEEEIAGGDQP